jgi:C1A family cysteine protease
MSKRIYNWHRSPLPLLTSAQIFRGDPATVFPSKFDLFLFQPPRFDQGQEGSCTANSACGEVRTIHRVLNRANDADFSRQLTYYLERKEQGTPIKEDSGSSIAESVAVLEKYGAALETLWPYDQKHFAAKPPASVLVKAKLGRISGSQPVLNDPAAFKAVLMKQRGVLIGFSVYESFESNAVAATGRMPMPKKGEQVLGGHAVRVIGWDDSTASYLVVNSWGEGWGDPKYPGCFWMPYDYLHKKKLGDDFHYIEGLS